MVRSTLQATLGALPRRSERCPERSERCPDAPLDAPKIHSDAPSTGVLQLGDGRKVSVTNSKAKDGDDE